MDHTNTEITNNRFRELLAAPKEFDFADPLSMAEAVEDISAFNIMNQSQFMLRQSQDVADMMDNREAFENGNDALEKLDMNYPRGAKIIVDVDWEMVARYGTYKKTITDNGCGMEPDKLSNFLLTVGNSDMKKRFNWGCRLATLYSNPLGVLFKTWTEPGSGATAILSGGTGVGRFTVDGARESALCLEDQFMHPLIKAAGHGTELVFLGRNNEDNTFMSPPNLGLGKKRFMDLRRWVNHRYFVPKVPIWIREFDSDDVSTWPTKKPRGNAGLQEAQGMKYLLTKESSFYKMVRIDEIKANVYVWLLKNGKKGVEYPFRRLAHFGAIHDGEIYERTFSRGGIGDFGFTQLAPRVVLYIEPWNATANTRRDGLTIGNNKLPWDRYKRVFRKYLRDHPAFSPLRRQENEEDKKGLSGSLDYATLKRDHAEWRKIMPGQDEYARNENGVILTEGKKGRPPGGGHTGKGGNEGAGGSGSEGKPKKNNSGGTTISPSKPATIAGGKELNKKEAKKQGIKGVNSSRRTRELVVPKPTWSMKPGEAGLDGYYCVYNTHTNQLLLNPGYDTFVQLVAAVAKECKLSSKIHTIEGMVRDHFARHTAVAVDQIRRKKDTHHWDETKMAHALSMENLSTIADTLVYPSFKELCVRVSRRMGSKTKRQDRKS